jgi:hypothetical protein
MLSNSKLNSVYGFPTLPGFILVGILGFCVRASIVNDSNIERLIFILMLVIGVIHLLEASYPFRMLEATCKTQDPQFHDEEVKLVFEISNTSNTTAEDLWVRLFKSDPWVKINPIEGNSVLKVTLPYTFKGRWRHPLPGLRVRSFSSLHVFWRVIEIKEEIIILPKPINHYIPPPPPPKGEEEDGDEDRDGDEAQFEEDKGTQNNQNNNNQEDHELNNLEEILEPSRFQFADPKLFQKTRKRYQRVFQPTQLPVKTNPAHEHEIMKVSFKWADLEPLPPKKKGEQFSYWIKRMEELKGLQETQGRMRGLQVEINIETPFLSATCQANQLNLPQIKSRFAYWYYGEYPVHRHYARD